MEYARKAVWYCVVAAGLLLVWGCGSQASPDGGRERKLTVLAASSLTDAFGELEETFERENPGTDVRVSFGASSALLAQVQQGSPADVFASADEVKMETAVEEGLVAGEPRTFARNRLVIVVPGDNPGGVEDYEDLAEPGLKIVLAQDEVPVAEYAKSSLALADGEYGEDFSRRVERNVVSREADVRACVNRVRLGDADATFGYRSDVTPDVRDEVRTVGIPEGLNVVATYPIATLEEAPEPELARLWVELVTGEEGQAVLEEWGFEPAP